ncbi:SAP domain-containing ribonucleoprotein, partial [Takifugu flavidus]
QVASGSLHADTLLQFTACPAVASVPLYADTLLQFTACPAGGVSAPLRRHAAAVHRLSSRWRQCPYTQTRCCSSPPVQPTALWLNRAAVSDAGAPCVYLEEEEEAKKAKMAEVVELQKLKLAELRQECDARGLATKGNKGELIARLQAYLDEHEDDVDVDDVLVEDAEDFTKSESDGVVNDIKDPESSVETLAEKKVVKISPASTASEVKSFDFRFMIINCTFKRPRTPPKAPQVWFAGRGLRIICRSAPDLYCSTLCTTSAGPGAAGDSKAPVNIDQLKKRAERFGMNVSTISQKIEEDERLKKRKERFGALTSGRAAGAADTEAKKRKRAERFGIV